MKDSDLPPFYRDYLGFKRTYPKAIVLVQHGYGDFDTYHAYGDDAKAAARILVLPLGSYSWGKTEGTARTIIPGRHLKHDILLLNKEGYAVAVAEQIGSEYIEGRIPREVAYVRHPSRKVRTGKGG